MAAAGKITVDVNVEALDGAIRRVSQSTRAVGIAFEAATEIHHEIDRITKQGGGDFSNVTDVEILRGYRQSHLQMIRQDLAFAILVEARITELETARAKA